MRPTTQGCSEQSCIYHGRENRFKAAHAETCPVRSYNGFVISAFEPMMYYGPECNCDQRELGAKDAAR
jgi:hypothetical protein